MFSVTFHEERKSVPTDLMAPLVDCKKSSLRIMRWNIESQLLIAIRSGNICNVEELVFAGADVDTRFRLGAQRQPAVCIATEKNDFEMVRLLLRLGCSTSQCDSSGLTPLHIACMNGSTDIVSLLLKGKANPNAVSKNGDTALHLACRRGYRGIVAKLLVWKAQVNQTNYSQRTALHFAAVSNSETIALLLKYKADPLVKDIYGNTPLHYAVAADGVGSKGVQTLCCSNSLALMITNYNDEMPIHVLLRSNRGDSEDILNLLLSELPSEVPNPTAILDYRTSLGHTLVHMAVLQRKTNLLRILVAAGANVDIKDHLDNSSLFYTAIYSMYETAEILIAAQADTSSLVYNCNVDNHVTNPLIRQMLLLAATQPSKLSSICRNVLRKILGPHDRKSLFSRFPLLWIQFMEFESLTL